MVALHPYHLNFITMAPFDILISALGELRMKRPTTGRRVGTKYNVAGGGGGGRILASFISIVEKKLAADETISIYVQRIRGISSKVNLL